MSKRTKLQNYVEYYALRAVMFFIYFFPRSLAHKIGRFIAVSAYYIVPIRKKHIIAMLTISFPEKSAEEIKEITKKVYINFVQTVVDIMFFPRMSDEQLKKMMIYDNEELIEKAHANGKGTILLSAHFGNWELTALSFSKRYPMSVIVAKQSNDLVDKMMNDIRTKQGFNTIYKDNPGQLFRGVMKALKRNDFVGVLSDQDAGKQGVFVPFFGRPASTPKGAALFAVKAGCPVITALGVRQQDGTMIVKLNEIRVEASGNEEDDIKRINTRYSEILEAAVRENPEQWFWFHRKWKTQP